MAEHASQEEIISTAKPYVLETILEIDQYPIWINDIKAVEVFERDQRGRALRARLDTFAMGKDLSHEHRYLYDQYPEVIRWELIQGDMVNKLNGSYTIKEIDENTTSVRYDLEAELNAPLPGFLKRKAANKIVESALMNLKKYCEQTFTQKM